ncbi:type II secretion system protein GspL [Gallaecimonas kandeliae]|uniref:type II secretion system protein GspL n=1 Tax=Gallaecimonas kandeliae TaxID=3029055 RepID=UPI00264A4CDC|nr:type II secretion system protein GspL [Gallaecimonas kandeliae]WKE65922.1 type II secretion system protein GspL [Gallaecimonas kandeliae]
MSNTLVIRLPQGAEGAIPWLHWSDSDQVVLASGTLKGADELAQLAGLDGRLLALVPGSCCYNGAVKQSGKGRQFLRAVPFMLEEELADDVDNLHFLLQPQGEQVAVLAVNHRLMQDWLSWLADAGLEPWKMQPDFLALPWRQESWSALELDGELLLRTGEVAGLAADAALAEWVVGPLVADKVQPVEAYGEVRLPDNCTLTHLGTDLPLAVLAKGGAANTLNLLQGPYKQKKKGSGALRRWLPVAVAASALLLVTLVSKGLAIHQLSARAGGLEQQIKADYGRLFPGEHLVSAGSLKSQLRGKLKTLGSAGSNASLLTMLNDLSLTFAKVGSIKPDNLRFDADRGELRILTLAPDYAAFEKLKQELGSRYQVETGGQSQVDGGVSGTLVLRSKG